MNKDTQNELENVFKLAIGFLHVCEANIFGLVDILVRVWQ